MLRTSPGGRLRPGLLIAAAALLVGRPLLPSEAMPSRGDQLPWNMLWIVLAATWLIGHLRRGRFTLRFGMADLALLIMIAWTAISGCFAVEHAAPRAAINATWQWVVVGLAFFLLRQLIHTRGEARALVVAMVALCVVESATGLHQYAISFPAMRRQYAEDPESMLREAGQPLAPGSAERQRFENRLMSREPLGTFALANSLAGLLVPWLVLAVAVVAFRGRGWRGMAKWRRPAAGIATAMPLAAVLILTKSRSAYLATVAGLLAFAAAGLFKRPSHRAKRRSVAWAAGLVAIVALVAAAWLAGGLDRQVLSEAPKSLSYRLEYWQSTLTMIRDQPWFGVGPGQFQDRYTRYKLPQASEEIADPHNFLLEIAATSGVPASLALLAFLALLFGRVIKPRPACHVQDGAFEKLSPEDKRLAWIAPPAGIALAWVVGLAFPALVDVPLDLGTAVALIAIAAIVAAVWSRWVEQGELPASVVAVALAALLIHLSAAGGIAFPGVAGTLWLLAALCLALTEPSGPPIQRPLWQALAGLVLLLAVAIGWYLTAYRPVVVAQGELLAASLPNASAHEVEAHLLAAARADPYSAEPWQRLAQQRFQRWLSQPTVETWASFDRALQRTVKLRPDSSVVWLSAGELYSAAFEKSGDRRPLRRAVESLRQAVSRYPTQAAYHAKLAIALKMSGKVVEAADEARTALGLSQATPHTDQKLSPELRASIRRIIRQAEIDRHGS